MHMATYISRDFYTELGGFNPDFKVAGDFEMFARARSRAPFERVRRRIACFRRTGMNYSAVNPEHATSELRLIIETFGPKSDLERRIWRRLLKVWINLRNPDFLMRKQLGSVLWRLSLQAKKYF